MIRIGFDTRFVASIKTGLGNYSRSLLNALVASDSGCEFCLFTSEPDSLAAFEHRENVRIYEVPPAVIPGSGRAATIAYEQLSLATAMLNEKLDLVHLPYYLEPALITAPYIVTILDMDTFLPSGRHSPLTRAYHNNLIRLHARRSAAIVTISGYSRDQIVSFLDIPREKVHVIYCGLSEGFLHQAAGGKPSTPSSFAPDGDYFLYSGGLGMRKNLQRMVDAFALARRATGSEARLVITGELAEVGRALREYTDTAGYGDFIDYPGYVHDRELPLLCAGAMASIYPSVNEGFGLPVIESLACGVPVITSRGSSMEEIARGHAILVDPLSVADIAAAIGALMSDPELAARSGGRGRQLAASYSWDKAAEQFLELYGEILDRKRVFC